MSGQPEHTRPKDSILVVESNLVVEGSNVMHIFLEHVARVGRDSQGIGQSLQLYQLEKREKDTGNKDDKKEHRWRRRQEIKVRIVIRCDSKDNRGGEGKYSLCE